VGSLPHSDRTNEIYLELVRERRLPSPYRSLTEKTIEQHLAGQVTVNLYAIIQKPSAANGLRLTPTTKRSKRKRDLAKLRKELLLENVYAVQDIHGEVGIYGSSAKIRYLPSMPPFHLQSRPPARRAHQGLRVADEGIEIFRSRICLHQARSATAFVRHWVSSEERQPLLVCGYRPADAQAQIEALCQLPKLTAEQLNDLTHKMPPPPQWETADDPPPASRTRSFSGNGGTKKPFDIYEHVPLHTSVQLAARTILCSARPAALL